MVDISIRPETFVGMRFYFVKRQEWGTYIKKFNGKYHSWRGELDIGGPAFSNCVKTVEPNLLLLSGEENCPVDPKNKEWEWRTGDRFWIKLAAGWRFDAVIDIDMDRLCCLNGRSLSLEYCAEKALHIPRENKPIINLKDYPKTCPNCGNPAYIGLNSIDCSNQECR